MRRLAAILLFPAIAVAAPARAEPPPTKAEATKQAMELHDQAASLYEAGRYREALAKLDLAIVLDPSSAELAYNLAVIHEKLGDLDRAEHFFVRSYMAEKDAKARDRLAAILRRIRGAREDKSALPQASRMPTAAPKAPPSPVRERRALSPWGIGSGVFALAALTVGTGFGISALVRNPGAAPKTGGGVTIADLEADAKLARRDALVADVSFAISATAAGVALLFFLTTPSRPSPSASVSMSSNLASWGSRGASLRFVF